ncbi:MAG TPA: DUF421 domain-containing protein [Halanaerobiales bacterium]|nr:DUF421 domain-containing protein [Halanaerobiales bacterium]
MQIKSMIFKTVVIYFSILIIIRIMGKREVGELSPFDLVIAIMIGEMAVFPIEEEQITLLEGLIPIFLLGLLEILLAFIALKNNKLRLLINGRPEVLIEDGKIKNKALQRTKYNLNDLLQQLRKNNIFDIDKVKFAILETSGELTVLEKGKGPAYYPVIIDGVISTNPLIIELDEEWLKKKIRKDGHQISEILLATIDESKKIKYYIKNRED